MADGAARRAQANAIGLRRARRAATRQASHQAASGIEYPDPRADPFHGARQERPRYSQDHDRGLARAAQEPTDRPRRENSEREPVAAEALSLGNITDPAVARGLEFSREPLMDGMRGAARQSGTRSRSCGPCSCPWGVVRIGRPKAVAESATRRDKRTAVNSSGEKLKHQTFMPKDGARLTCDIPIRM